MAILVVTSRDDVTADLVIGKLNARGIDVHRIDPADIPGRLTVTGQVSAGKVNFTLRDERRTTRSAEIDSIYWRKPGAPKGTADLSAEHQVWAGTETATSLYGLLLTLRDVVWVNHPANCNAARHKPGQLVTAAQMGMGVPDTLFTCSREEARQFAEEHGKAVVKTLTQTDTFHPARLVGPDELDGVQHSMHVLQEPVNKAYDVRVTVVDERMFAAKITTTSGDLDWRAAPREQQVFEIIPFTRPLFKKIENFMAHYGLHYGAFDFAVDTSGMWWFLECNPNGQFGFIEAATGMVISRAIADLLVQEPLATRTFTPDGGHRASSVPRRRFG